MKAEPYEDDAFEVEIKDKIVELIPRIRDSGLSSRGSYLDGQKKGLLRALAMYRDHKKRGDI